MCVSESGNHKGYINTGFPSLVKSRRFRLIHHLFVKLTVYFNLILIIGYFFNLIIALFF